MDYSHEIRRLAQNVQELHLDGSQALRKRFARGKGSEKGGGNTAVDHTELPQDTWDLIQGLNQGPKPT